MKIRALFIVVVALALAVSSSGCGGIQSFGERISNRNITPIKDIVVNQGQFVGKAVTVKGVITAECNSGCWFNLKDDGVVIYTDINPSGFAIPQKVGRTAVVEGTVSVEGGRLTLTGKAVEIQ